MASEPRPSGICPPEWIYCAPTLKQTVQSIRRAYTIQIQAHGYQFPRRQTSPEFRPILPLANDPWPVKLLGRPQQSIIKMKRAVHSVQGLLSMKQGGHLRCKDVPNCHSREHAPISVAFSNGPIHRTSHPSPSNLISHSPCSRFLYKVHIFYY